MLDTFVTDDLSIVSVITSDEFCQDAVGVAFVAMSELANHLKIGSGSALAFVLGGRHDNYLKKVQNSV